MRTSNRGGLAVSLTMSMLMHAAVFFTIYSLYRSYEAEHPLLQLTEIDMVEEEMAKPKEELKPKKSASFFEKARWFLPSLGAPVINKQALTNIPNKLPVDTVRLVRHDDTKVKDVIPPGWLQSESRKIPVKMKGGGGINLASTGRLPMNDFGSALDSEGLGSKLGNQGLILRKQEDADKIIKRVQKQRGDFFNDMGDTPGRIKDSGFKDAYAIGGEIRGRNILHVEMPIYPPWAEEQGVEASVTLQVHVEPDGSVKTNSIIVLKTSGYAELDRLAKEALSKWYFSPLSESVKQKIQSGTVRFIFKLNRG